MAAIYQSWISGWQGVLNLSLALNISELNLGLKGCVSPSLSLNLSELNLRLTGRTKPFALFTYQSWISDDRVCQALCSLNLSELTLRLTGCAKPFALWTYQSWLLDWQGELSPSLSELIRVESQTDRVCQARLHSLNLSELTLRLTGWTKPFSLALLEFYGQGVLPLLPRPECLYSAYNSEQSYWICWRLLGKYLWLEMGLSPLKVADEVKSWWDRFPRDLCGPQRPGLKSAWSMWVSTLFQSRWSAQDLNLRKNKSIPLAL